jgi:hypothetical protein
MNEHPTAVERRPIPKPRTSVPGRDENAIFDCCHKLSSALEGLSKKEIQKALTMIASLHNLRVVPTLAPPLGAAPITVQARPQSHNAIGTKGIAPQRAKWKENPQWVSYLHNHATKVAEIKAAPAEARAALADQLHELEQSGKALKHQLQPFRGQGQQD